MADTDKSSIGVVTIDNTAHYDTETADMGNVLVESMEFEKGTQQGQLNGVSIEKRDAGRNFSTFL